MVVYSVCYRIDEINSLTYNVGNVKTRSIDYDIHYLDSSGFALLKRCHRVS
jgi:hypothetical protein